MEVVTALVNGGVVSPGGDDTLLLAHYLITGVLLGQRTKGKGKLLMAAHTKRAVASALQISEGEVPAILDGSDAMVLDLTFPTNGFTHQQFKERFPRVTELADAYGEVGRIDAAAVLRRIVENIKEGYSLCEVERSQLLQNSGEGGDFCQNLEGVVHGKVVLRKDSAGKPRILFHLGEKLLHSRYVGIVSNPSHHARQVDELLEASKDLRGRWDNVASSLSLNVGKIRICRSMMRRDVSLQLLFSSKALS
jgi:hypothetical protein